MPKTKDALIRYRVIDRMLVNRKYVTIQELMEACSDYLDRPVSERTIRQDLFNMQNDRGLDFMAPIRNKRPKLYYYTDPNYSITKLPLTLDEVDSLEFAGKMLEQFSNMEPFDQIQGAIKKVFNHIRIRRNLNHKQHSDYIDFEKAPDTGGLEYIGPLLNAIKEKYVVKLKYQAFTSKKIYSHTFNPYLLKEYSNRWYVFGYNEYWKSLRLYALDRVKKVERLIGEEYRPSAIPPKDYFRNVIGVTRFEGTEPREVRLKFTAHQAPYVLSQPLHESQQVEEQTGNHTIISLKVHESPELDIILLGWNKEVEVLEPPEYRKKIKGLVEGAASLYNI